jgi:hypothetical protein
MAMIKKKAMGKPMTKAKNGTQTAKSKKVVKKSPPPYDDDMNDRLMADTYTKYMADKKAGKIPLDPIIQGQLKRGEINPDGSPKTVRGSESNMSRTPMKKGGAIKKKMKIGGAVKKAKFGMASVKAKVDNNPNPTAADRIVLAKKNAGKAKNGASMKKCKYGCK